MSKLGAEELLKQQGYYPSAFYICKHNQHHRHKCDHCKKYMLEGEEQVLVAFYNNTYDAIGGPKATLVAYDIICRKCHPGVIPKGFAWGSPVTEERVV